MTSFSNPVSVSGYAQRTARLVPGLTDLHRMTALLLAERSPEEARILVLGAGGGLELKAFAGMYPNWRFCGVDPSTEMLDQARTELGTLAARVQLLNGYIENAPEDPFDGAVCLLTLHFLPEEERLRTLREIHRRLKPGAAFVAAHHSFPNDAAGKDRWLARYAAFAAASGMPGMQSENGIAAMKERLPVLPPEEDAALLREAGFSDVELFYCAFTFKGWVGYAN
ncbi:class I SAM-dependent methyltransferase [Roseibium marinum]|uniref:tRNA (Cmo5U34)-methyltransferase n=1 Tax=Roseibium marinum TaxID=281252 RepID=A0A2S3US57_9HYPH|nr:class I SAM-dependent methyltransferase [Roseibium marinum]POF30555.1 tRNA (cmo5U34)-methyltransferase [Roseibium marinum]